MEVNSLQRSKIVTVSDSAALADLTVKYFVNYAQQAIEQSNEHNLIITGIPRSGTSLLCRLLHKHKNTVVLNEPIEIFEPLTDLENTNWLFTYYRTLRQEILQGNPIENKLADDGLPVDDTKFNDARVSYVPKIDSENFLLGTKNTLLYVSRLRLLRMAMPNAKIVCCVRNPIDTIVSWEHSFPHLREVDFDRFPKRYLEHPFLTISMRDKLLLVNEQQNLRIRRALFWNVLSEMILDHENDLILLRYEDLIANPCDAIKKIFSEFGG